MGRVVHRRTGPVRHEFRYRLSLLCFDVEDAGALERTAPWLGVGRRAILSWWRGDHVGDPGASLGDTVRRLVEERTGSRPLGAVWLITSPRVLGYGFNPISLFLCHDVHGAVEAIVAEVTSTPWKERHAYVLAIPQAERGRSVHRFVTPKRLHVSPFLGMEQIYRWRVALADAGLSVAIVAATGEARPFAAVLSVVPVPLGRASIARLLLQPPLGAAGTMAAIHYQALRLWWKGAPFHPHPHPAGGEPGAAKGEQDGNRECPA